MRNPGVSPLILLQQMTKNRLPIGNNDNSEPVDGSLSGLFMKLNRLPSDDQVIREQR